MVNLEINGPGQAVFAEMQALRRRAASMPRAQDEGLRNFLGGIQYYLYRRADSMGGSAVYHWKTTSETKERALNTYRDLVDRNEAVLRSEGLLDEMAIVVREDGFLGATGRGKDDRVIASALAAVQYFDFIKFKLASEQRTYAAERSKKERAAERERKSEVIDVPTSHALQRGVRNYLRVLGIK
jgi:hypothetical protein